MSRLTERELNVMDCASYTKCNTDECVGYCGGCNAEEEAKLKLKHYEDLEEQGRLIVLPCKVGDEFWELNDVNEPFIYPRKALTIQHCVYVLERLGRKAFLTKAEAEKALAEMEK